MKQKKKLIVSIIVLVILLGAGGVWAFRRDTTAGEQGNVTASTEVAVQSSVTATPKTSSKTTSRPVSATARVTAAPTPKPTIKPKATVDSSSSLYGWWYVDKAMPVYKCPTLDCEIIGTSKAQRTWQATGKALSVFGFTAAEEPGYIARAGLTYVGTELAPCSMPLKYKMGTVSSEFAAAGFTSSALTSLAIQAEKEWEGAVGKNLVDYTAGSLNTVWFGGSVNGEDTGMGAVDRGSLNEEKFTMYFELQIANEALNISWYVNPDTMSAEELYQKRKDQVYATLLHEFGHVFGLEHTPQENKIMSEEIDAFITNAHLTSTDKAMLTTFCNS